MYHNDVNTAIFDVAITKDEWISSVLNLKINKEYFINHSINDC